MAEAYWVNETQFWGADPAGPVAAQASGTGPGRAGRLSEFPHVIVNQARLLDFLLEHMRNSPSRFRVDYGHEAVTVKAPDSDDEPVLVTMRRGGDGAGRRSPCAPSTSWAATARTASCVSRSAEDGAPRRGQGLGGHGPPRGDRLPGHPPQGTIQSGDGGNILLIPREGGYLVRLYVDMGEIAADAWLDKEDVIAGPSGCWRPTRWTSRRSPGTRSTGSATGSPTSSTMSTRRRWAPVDLGSSSRATPVTRTPQRPARG